MVSWEDPTIYRAASGVWEVVPINNSLNLLTVRLRRKQNWSGAYFSSYKTPEAAILFWDLLSGTTSINVISSISNDFDNE
jgi:hypothetical protein